VLAVVSLWALTTDDERVWPVRNTLQYRAVTGWWGLMGGPRYGDEGVVIGTVRDAGRGPVGGARVLLTRWDGMTYLARTELDGGFKIEHVPSGTYTAVAGAAGYAEGRKGSVQVAASVGRRLELALRTRDDAMPTRYGGVSVVRRGTAFSEVPIQARAVRWELFYIGPTRFDRPAQGAKVFLYVPWGTDEQSHALPLLVTAYPGPAEEWESASVPLAAAGYAVVAYGPPYGFDPERAVFALAGLVRQAQEGRMPGVDGTRVAVLGGSYSGVHVLRLMQQDVHPAIKAAVLMGAPSDLFDMRRRLEERTFVPPFGLDQALIALGFPDREALRYWKYSGAYHVRAGMPPTLLIHSRQDDVVPYQQSELLARMLTEEGVPNELHLLDGGSHYLLSQEVDARAIHDLTLHFLRERLGV